MVLEGISLDKLALAADKATDCTRASTVAATDSEVGLQQLKQQINELTQAVAKISASRSRSRSQEKKNSSEESVLNLLTDLSYATITENLEIKHGNAYNRVRQSFL